MCCLCCNNWSSKTDKIRFIIPLLYIILKRYSRLQESSFPTQDTTKYILAEQLQNTHNTSKFQTSVHINYKTGNNRYYFLANYLLIHLFTHLIRNRDIGYANNHPNVYPVETVTESPITNIYFSCYPSWYLCLNHWPGSHVENKQRGVATLLGNEKLFVNGYAFVWCKYTSGSSIQYTIESTVNNRLTSKDITGIL